MDLTEALVEESPDALIAIAVDGTVTYWNRGAEVMYGYARDEIVGRGLDDFIVPADRLEESRRAFELVSAGGTVLLETVRRTRHGALIDVHVSMQAVAGEDGAVGFVAVNHKDVTQLKRHAETRVREEIFRGLLETAPDAMVIVDGDGRIVLLNGETERMFCYRRDELIGQPVEMLVPAYVREGTGIQLSGVRKDGSELPVEMSLSPMTTEGGVLVSSSIRDITERRKAERALIEANRMKSQFLANMSHELRTPLNAIIGFADLLAHETVAAAAQKEYLGIILSSSRHLLQLINDILDLSKVESGKMEFRPAPVDLGALVAEVLGVLRGMAAEKRIRIESSVDPAVAQAHLDAARIKQVLYNYLSNAIKFTPEGGHVAIRIDPHGDDELRLEVEDDGIGIAPESLGLLFVEFQQLDGGADKRYQGTGLGLALVRRIVELQGGRVEVRSTPGQGSTFAAILPRRQIV